MNTISARARNLAHYYREQVLRGLSPVEADRAAIIRSDESLGMFGRRQDYRGRCRAVEESKFWVVVVERTRAVELWDVTRQTSVMTDRLGKN